ncbi:MAG: YeeE/YedE thiosulfate transporter family protein [Gammaproteobacteria bacterium]
MSSKRTLRIHLIYGLLGLTMGATLSAIGFADYDEVFKMFTFQDYRMLLSFALAVGVAAVFFTALHFTTQQKFEKKLYHPGTIPGSIIFGYGWAICGACPSIVFIQLGQGKLLAVFTLLGIYLGVRTYSALHARYFGWDTGTCGI